jgi:hypothetical protein
MPGEFLTSEEARTLKLPLAPGARQKMILSHLDAIGEVTGVRVEVVPRLREFRRDTLVKAAEAVPRALDLGLNQVNILPGGKVDIVETGE